MTTGPRKQQDAAEAGLSAIQEALNLPDEDPDSATGTSPVTADEATGPVRDILPVTRTSPALDAALRRTTNETDVGVAVDLDGAGASASETGIGFLDHMLELLARHARI